MIEKKFSLIICTYQRSLAVKNLLNSLMAQILIPKQTLIIDGSQDENTRLLTTQIDFPGLEYFKVDGKDRGLTRQRNFGISKVSPDSKIICFLDDDVILTPDFFTKLLSTYHERPNAIGVGGYIIDEVKWNKKPKTTFNEYEIDGYTRKLGSRNVLRKIFGLLPKEPPGMMPASSNGFSTGFLPPSDKIYRVEYFMGGVASYRKDLFQKVLFSPYFEGYGLYEDMDFCLRASEFGQLYVNTAAKLYHNHAETGRPNKYKYGKMVIRNGWYVWRVKNPSPKLNEYLKWHSTAFILTIVRIGNMFSSPRKREAFFDSLGRIVGWWSLIFKKPKLDV